MGFRLAYTTQELYSKRHSRVKAEIYINSDTPIVPKIITLSGESPIRIEYDWDKDPFKSLVQSRCTINVVTKKPLFDLYTGRVNDIVCIITENGSRLWSGFLTPNIYNSGYDIGYNELSLEFIDILAQLDNITFKQENYYSTFYDYFKRGISKLDDGSLSLVTTIHEDINSEQIAISDIGCLERNYVDETGNEEDGAMSYKEVFESIMAYLGKTMFFYGDTIFIMKQFNVDHDIIIHNLADDSTSSLSYPSRQWDFKGLSDVTLSVADNVCDISLGDIYNKVTLIANNNPVKNVIPDLFDDNKFKSIMQPNENYVLQTIDEIIDKENAIRGYLNISKPAEENKYALLNAFFTNEDWNMASNIITSTTTYPEGQDTGIPMSQVKKVKTITKITNEFELWYWAYVDYNDVEHDLNIISFIGISPEYGYYWYMEGANGNLIVNAPFSDEEHTHYIGGNTNTTTINTGPVLDFQHKGYEIMNTVPNPSYLSANNLKYLSGGIFIQRYSDYKLQDGVPASISWKKCLSFVQDSIPLDSFTLSSGGPTDSYKPVWDEKVKRISLVTKPGFVGMGGYFIISMDYMFSNIRGYANTAPFRFTPEKYGEVLEYSRTDTKGIVKTEDGIVPAFSNGVPINGVFRDDKFYCQLRVGNMYYNGDTNSWTTTKSYFILRHTNRDQDTIFGQSKKIDNTVDFRWNLADDTSGFAIPLPPNQILSGELDFTLYADSRLGGTAQWPKQPNIIATGDAGYHEKYDGDTSNASRILSIHVTNLKLVYTTSDTVEDIYNLQEYDADVLYTNVIDESFMQKMDDIELTTNTFTPHATSFSYVLRKKADGGFEYVTDTLDGKNQETQIVEKYVKYYSKPKLIYTNTLYSYDKEIGQNFLPYDYIKLSSTGNDYANIIHTPISLNYDVIGSTMDGSFITSFND